MRCANREMKVERKGVPQGGLLCLLCGYVTL